MTDFLHGIENFVQKLLDMRVPAEMGLAGASGLDSPRNIHHINKTHTVRRAKLSPPSATATPALAGK
jgi:hypothetical protein